MNGMVTMGTTLQVGKDPLAGDWSGSLAVGASSLRLVFHVKAVQGGGWAATMDSPDQGAFGLPASDVTHSAGDVIIWFGPLKAGFKGKLSADGKRIAGKWSQGGRDFALELSWSERPIERPKRPQEPKGPFPYRIDNVRFASRADGVQLAGTLCTPRGIQRFPAVVLVSGSGPQDRDESLLGHKPFAVIADQLARAGIASLRYDDRGVGKSTGDFAAASSADFADDTEGAVRFLKQRVGIRPDRIGIAGHSEGGLIGPMVAARCPDVAFLILLAGPGVPGKEILPAQSDAIQKALGVALSTRSKNLALQHAMIALALELRRMSGTGKPDPELVRNRLKTVVDRFVAGLNDTEKTAFADTREQLEAQFDSMVTPWFQFFLEHDPRPILRAVKVPVLVLNGSRDLQVLPGQNVPEIVAALRSGGNRQVESRILPGLNHLFQTCTTGSPDEYGRIEESFAPKAIREMVGFVKRLG